MSTARFLSRTNGVPNWEVQYLSSLSVSNAQFMRRWLDAGTNAAVFRITNVNRWPIHVLTPARFDVERRGTNPPLFTPLLSASNYYGLRIEAGQSANVTVAVFPHDQPWRVGFYYVPADDGRFRPSWALRDAAEEVVRRVSGRSLMEKPEDLWSDWVKPRTRQSLVYECFLDVYGGSESFVMFSTGTEPSRNDAGDKPGTACREKVPVKMAS
ncbi:MAG: hypothetical protein ACYDH9_05055 [Limisphaerales bacterium]